MRAEEDRRSVAVAVRLDTAIEVSDRRPDLRTRVVLVDVESEVAKVPRDRVGDRALLAGRTG
jgi:hypothetical protein